MPLRLRSLALPATLLALTFLALVPGACETSSSRASSEGAPARALRYPEARRGEVVDSYFGVEVADPYRWLEDPDSPESRAWIEAQNALTQSWLAPVSERPALRRRLEELWNYERYGTPWKQGERYFFTRNDGLQNQSVLYVADSLEAEPRVLIDPNTLSADGTIALSGRSFSEDGRYVAYGTAEGGSDWNTWHVRDVDTGEDLADEVRWVKFSGASWRRDGSGFYYSRYDAPEQGSELSSANYFHKCYFHRLGTPQSEDLLVYDRPDQKEWNLNGTVTDDGSYLILHVRQGSSGHNRVFFKRLEREDPRGGPAIELLAEGDARYSFVDNDGPVFWFRTDLEAPRGRLIAIDTGRPERGAWRELIPEADQTLTGVSVVGEHFVCNYLEDAHTLVKVHDLKGRFVRRVALPGLGTASGFAGVRERSETFYRFTGYTRPGDIRRYDVRTGEDEVFRSPELAFDPERFTTEQVFFSSNDGTRVPMFLTYRKGLKRDGSNPCLLYGYGGFNISLTPSFDPGRIAWMELGGVFAVANLRGGGEYGQAWHEAGTKLDKQNVFDDFIAAAEWLIDRGYTRAPRLAIQGGSNGGLLVGACLAQRPELFGAALPAVGVMDMLRFQRFTIGWAWTSDYGSADENEAEFRALRAYSPYHNLRRGTCYPPTLVTTADHDDRVVPAHSFKFAAALQHAQGCSNPALIRIDVRAGHGAGKPTSKRIDQLADELAFLVRALQL